MENTVDDQVEIINPNVNAVAEFLEILNDFGNPLELLREAISNTIDAGASWIKILFDVQEIDGSKRLVVVISDNGHGMTKDVIHRDFWGLGYSTSRDHKDAIGEKGHGTKIYLRSERIEVFTQSKDGAYYSYCDTPLRDLSKGEIHRPKIQKIENLWDHTGTMIRIIGYNDNQRSQFVEPIVKDYLLWFTKIGSIEKEFGINKLKEFKVHLKCLDMNEEETISFGHYFPEENSDISKLFDLKSAAAADWYVKRHHWKNQRLTEHPEVMFDVIISVEGDEIKRSYNPMIRARTSNDTGRYRTSDRYGIWLCKDYIPVKRVNEWVTGFGSGSNAFVLLHGFINCQALKLTANRGDIANTDQKILDELKSSVQKLISVVDNDLNNNGIYTLRGWQEESRTLNQEKIEFQRRVKNLKNRKIAIYNNQLLLEPLNESELFGLFMRLYTLFPDSFDFEPLDYNTTRGIDLIARNKSPNLITVGEFSYIELKHILRPNKFNHAFEFLRWILCWDFDKSLQEGTEFQGIEETDIRRLCISQDKQGNTLYFLDNVRRTHKIQIIRLKELLKSSLKIEFIEENG